MERICNSCGALVSGEGGFCPSCGALMSGWSDSTQNGVDLTKSSMPSASDPIMSDPGNNGYQSQFGYPQPYYQQQYQQPNYMQNYGQAQEMTVGQWLLTIFLSQLGIAGIILMFVWAFSDSVPIAKKNFSRAMLIFEAILIGLFVLIGIVVPAVIGTGFLLSGY